MDNEKIGKLICQLRKEMRLTQLQLAQQMNISDKTISKWERGAGCPDISLLSNLSELFSVDLEKLLSGNLDSNDILGGNMKQTNFYVCPNCGNVITAMADAAISCCGKKLKAIEPQKAADEEKLNAEIADNQLYITADHPMTKEHYIAFVALLTFLTRSMESCCGTVHNTVCFIRMYKKVAFGDCIPSGILSCYSVISSLQIFDEISYIIKKSPSAIIHPKADFSVPRQ